jgi:hypothetical protein
VSKGNRTIVLALVLGLATAAPAALAAPAPAFAADDVDPARLTIAREIVAAVLPPDQREKIMSNALDAMMNNMIAGSLQGKGVGDDIRANPKLRAVFERFVDRQRDLAMGDIREALPELVEAYARAYARIFSLVDLQAIAVFVKTPAGTHFVQRGPGLLSDPDVAKWQRDLAAKSIARQSGELARFRVEIEAVRKDAPRGT